MQAHACVKTNPERSSFVLVAFSPFGPTRAQRLRPHRPHGPHRPRRRPTPTDHPPHHPTQPLRRPTPHPARHRLPLSPARQRRSPDPPPVYATVPRALATDRPRTARSGAHNPRRPRLATRGRPRQPPPQLRTQGPVPLWLSPSPTLYPVMLRSAPMLTLVLITSGCTLAPTPPEPTTAPCTYPMRDLTQPWAQRHYGCPATASTPGAPP